MKVKKNCFNWSEIFRKKHQEKYQLENYRKRNQNYVYRKLGDLWTYVRKNAEKLNYLNVEPEDYQQEELSQLRAIYPELEGINDSSLNELYFSYQGSFNLVNGYDIYREEAFVFYLICDLAKINFQEPEDIFIGEIIANFLLQGKSIEEAKKIAIQIREIYRNHEVYFGKNEREEILPIWEIEI